MSGATERVYNFPLPAWTHNQLETPSISKIVKVGTGSQQSSAELVYEETVRNHRILDQYPGDSCLGPCKIIRTLIDETIDVIVKSKCVPRDYSDIIND